MNNDKLLGIPWVPLYSGLTVGNKSLTSVLPRHEPGQFFLRGWGEGVVFKGKELNQSGGGTTILAIFLFRFVKIAKN